MKLIKFVLTALFFLNLNCYDEFFGNKGQHFQELHRECLEYLIENILDTKTIRYVYRPKIHNIKESNVIKRYLNIVASKCAIKQHEKITAEGIEQAYFIALSTTPDSAQEAYYIITGLDSDSLNMHEFSKIYKNFSQWFFPKFLAITDKLTIAANPAKL